MFHATVHWSQNRKSGWLLHRSGDASGISWPGSRRGVDMSILEGVMGYYDGIGRLPARPPVTLWLPLRGLRRCWWSTAKGMGLSVAAVVEGYCRFQPDSRIRGVILNRISPCPVSGAEGARLKPAAVSGSSATCRRNRSCTLESRHLGLVCSPEEVAGLREKLAAPGGPAGGDPGPGRDCSLWQAVRPVWQAVGPDLTPGGAGAPGRGQG